LFLGFLLKCFCVLDAELLHFSYQVIFDGVGEDGRVGSSGGVEPLELEQEIFAERECIVLVGYFNDIIGEFGHGFRIAIFD
jgi:hypothetical protein